MTANLEPLLAQLHLDQAGRTLAAWLERAAQEDLSYADFLAGLLEEELTARTNVAVQRRLREAEFPFAASIEQFDFRFRPELKRQVLLRYLDPTFVAQATTLTLVGPPGLGKTISPSASLPNRSSSAPRLASSPLRRSPTSSAARQPPSVANACSNPCSPVTC